MVSGRTNRHKRRFGRAFHYRVDRLAGRACGPQRRFERITRDQGVVIKIALALADCFFHMFEVLRGVTRLSVAAPLFAGLALQSDDRWGGLTAHTVNTDAI